MSFDYQQDPNQQAQQYDQYGDPIQQPQQNQGQWGQQQDPSQQGQFGNQDPSQQGQFGGARQQAQQQIDQAIDQYGNKIPGGQRFTQQAKDKVPDLLGEPEGEAEERMGGLGGMFGGNQGNQQ